MKILSLDLSTVSTGWSKFSEDGTLLCYGKIVPLSSIEHNFNKIRYIVDQLILLFPETDCLVVEGIFLNTFKGNKHNVTGFEVLARLSGAVINAWLKQSKYLPKLLKATEARPLVGLKGSCQKAEVQLWAINNFEQLTKIDYNDANAITYLNNEYLPGINSLIDACYAEKGTKVISQAVFKARMGKISKVIEEDTGLGEDIADSLLLGRAFCNLQGKI